MQRACLAGPVGTDGTNDESLDHLSCLFAQYLYQNFGQSNSDVALVGHSMGGIIIRNTLARVQTDGGQGTFPTNVGQVTDAITINTPHTGVDYTIGFFACGGCQQVSDLSDKSDLMTYLSALGRNPQASGVTTDWTVMGSENDPVDTGAESTTVLGTGAANAVDMNARHAIMYLTPSNYDHTQMLHDMDNINQDAHQYYCDTTDPENNPCGIDYKNGANWKYRENGPRSLLEFYTELTSDAS